MRTLVSPSPRLKDSDVTWLYGPLHTAVEPVPPTKIASAEERLGIVRHDSSTTQFSNNSANSANGGAPTKPILKHRTLSEMLTIPMPASPVLEAVQNDSIDDYDVEEGRPGLLHTKSDTNIVRKGLRRKSPPRGPIGSGGRTPVNPAELSQPGSGERTPEAGPASGGKKHISFNTFVEQCIAVDDPAEIPGIEEEADDTEDDDEDDGMLEMRSSSSASSSRSSRSSSRPSLSRHSSSSSQPEHMTIAKIAPTTLKALGSFPSPSPQIIYAPPEEYAAEHDDQTGITYRHSPSPGSERWGYNPSGSATEQAQKAQRIAVSPTWDDEDDYSVGFDYFSGPDLGVGDEYNTGQRAGGTRQVQSHVGSGASYGKGQQQQQQVSASNSATATPTVNQAPPQARWRAGSSSEDSSNQSSQNSTARPTPVQSPGGEIVGAVSPPQPGRSILKIRPPGHQAPEPAEISPTSSYFNFKPSAATGLGGLDQGVRRVIKEPAAGSLPLYDQADNAYFVQPGNPANNGPIATVQTPPLASPHSVPTSPAHSRSSDEPESRGRSSTRAGGSVSSVDKSTSRGSVASVSVSPNSARSPVQIPGGGAKYPKPSQGDPAAGTVKSPTPGPGQKQAGNVNPAQVQAAPPPQVPTPVGMSQPKDDVELKKEENAKKREEDKQQAEAEHDVESRGQEYVPERSSTPTPHSSPQVRFHTFHFTGSDFGPDSHHCAPSSRLPPHTDYGPKNDRHLSLISSAYSDVSYSGQGGSRVDGCGGGGREFGKGSIGKEAFTCRVFTECGLERSRDV